MSNPNNGIGAFFKKKPKDQPDSKESPEWVFSGSKNRDLICHFMFNNTKEVGKPKKIKIYEQEVTWNKRTYPIERTRIITDKDGIAHAYFDANDSAHLSFNKDHADKCKKCGHKMTIDARNGRDLVKRKVISALWSMDTLPMLLLIVMGIIMLVMMVAVFYLYGDIQQKDALLAHYLKPPTTGGT